MNEIHLDTTRLDQIAAGLGVKTEAVVRRFAFQVEGEAKANAPYDTGAMANSLYTNTADQNGYDKAASDAAARNPKVETSPIPAPQGKTTATVGAAVNYALFVELGTSKQAAQPFLLPAVEHLAQKYNDGKEWEEIVKP